ncbi:hypothetical protein DSL72_002694 [Monilinia vaccinii-corymbosi]|uniref:Uncharacterized protein n=1 Tax=Monilinia vaccinii-corymbosi TaxID=61207 RepID=A0A8A3PDE7_9HELO|nr:hypothetical protein DSL72_002694 [Monilinia vaccinii-corymbosi]
MAKCLMGMLVGETPQPDHGAGAYHQQHEVASHKESLAGGIEPASNNSRKI